MSPSSPLRLLALVLGALVLLASRPTSAAAADPAIAPIEAFDASLAAAMKAGKTAGAEGRYKALLPVVERTFDLPLMIRFAVGPPFAGYSPSEQADLARAFGRLTAANLAHNFDSYGGETFKIDPDVQTRGPDKLVRTQIIPTSGPPTDLNYRMRFSGSSWKVIDVYFGAISQLTAQRSDFAATVSMGGAAGLLKTIDAQTQKLLNH